MKQIDYIKKLGIKIDGSESNKKLKNFITTQLGEFRNKYQYSDTGYGIASIFYKRNCIAAKTINLSSMLRVFEKEKDIKKVILYYTSFLIIIKYYAKSGCIDPKVFDLMIYELEDVLYQHNLGFEIFKDEDGVYLLSIGHTELDQKLIIDSMEWLKDYPDIRTQAIDALNTYYNREYGMASEVVDKYRKLLEQFMQRYFNSSGALTSLKSNYGSKLKEAGVSKEIANGFEKILNLYDMYNNNHAKHHNDACEYDIEYIMYETFNIIRLLLQIERK